MKVVVAGNFFPLHDGHVDHFKKARKLGDYLIAIIGSDDYLKMRGKKPYLSEINRKAQLGAWVDEVVVAIDTDGTINKTIRQIRPDIYAKGEDTKEIPELETCREIGCEVIFGVGEEKFHSSKL